MQSRPKILSLNHNHPLASKLVLDAWYGEGGGVSCNLVTGQKATVNGTLGWQKGGRYCATTQATAYDTFRHPAYNTKYGSLEIAFNLSSFSGVSFGNVTSLLPNSFGLQFGDPLTLINANEMAIILSGSSTNDFTPLKMSTPFSTNTFYRVIVTVRRNNFVYAYVNGKLDSAQGPSRITLTNASATSSSTFSSASNSPQGIIYSVRYWNRPLSESEVQSLYKNPLGIYTFSLPNPPITEPVPPTFTGSFNKTIGHATISSSSSNTLPIYTGNTTVSSSVSIAASASRTVPIYTGSATLTSANSSMVSGFISGLAVRWKLDNNFNDIVGNYDGTGYGSASFVMDVPPVPYVGSYSAHFPIYSYMDSHISYNLKDLFTSEATLVMWIKIPDPSSSHALLHLCDLDVVDNPYSWYPWGGDGIFYCNLFRTSRIAAGLNGGIDRSGWHMLSITTKPGTGNYCIYQNNINIFNTTGEANIYVGSFCSLGRDIYYGFVGDTFFDGYMSDVRLYNRALSADEIDLLYRGDDSPVNHFTSAPVGTLSVNITHPTISASATCPMPTFTGTLTKTINASVFTAESCLGPNSQLVTQGWGYNQRILTRSYALFTMNYDGDSTLSINHTISSAATRVVPVYAATLNLSNHPQFISAAIHTPPVYAATLTKTVTSATISAAGICPASFGSASSTATHATISGSGVITVPIYTAAASMTVTSFTMIASTLPAYVGHAFLSTTTPSISMMGTFVVPIYTGSFSKNIQHATISVSTTYIPLDFSSTLTKTVNHPTLTGNAVFVIPIYSGSTAVNITHTITSTGSLVVPIYVATSTRTVNHATISANASCPASWGSLVQITNHAILGSDGTCTIPVYTGSFNRLISKTFYSTGNDYGPFYLANSDINISGLLLTVDAVHIVQTFTGTCVLTKTSISLTSDSFFNNHNNGFCYMTIPVIFTSGGTSTLPVYIGRCNVETQNSFVNSDPSFTIPNPNGTINHQILHPFTVSFAIFRPFTTYGTLTKTISHPTFTSNATFVIGAKHGTLSKSVTHPTISASGVFTISNRVVNILQWIATMREYDQHITTQTRISTVYLWGTGSCQQKPNF